MKTHQHRNAFAAWLEKYIPSGDYERVCNLYIAAVSEAVDEAREMERAVANDMRKSMEECMNLLDSYRYKDEPKALVRFSEVLCDAAARFDTARGAK